MYKNTIIATLIILLLVVFYGSFLAHKVNLFTADLGRHIKNGEYFFQELKVPTTNLYSYTEPDFPVVNHHWGAGVIFYLLWKAGGFILVHLVFVIVSLLTFLIFFWMAVKRSSLGIAALVAIPVIPLLAERTEIRPEVFSYLFAGIFLWILTRSPSPNDSTVYPSPLAGEGDRRSDEGDHGSTPDLVEGKLSPAFGTLPMPGEGDKVRLSPSPQGRGNKLLFLLPIIQILWVNTHIYFFLGPVIVAVFVFQKPINRHATSVLLLTILATLVNPFGYQAVIEPFNILREYGYRVVENQPVWFIEKLIKNPNFLIFKIVFGLLVLSFVYRFVRSARTPSQSPPIPDPGRGRGRNLLLADILLMLGFSTMAWLQIRNFAIFGLFALPIMAGNFAVRTPPSPSLVKEGVKLKLVLGVLAIILILILSRNLNYLFPYWHEFGIGLEKNNDAAADFFKSNNLRGPIFNNYDIGGYLIYYLYPQEKVFVDNRPEAYSVDFFQKIYIPMQENDDEWRSLDQKYNFNAIFFSHRDATPWGQNFLLNRIKDPEWTQAYLDQYSIILLRK